MKKRIMTAALVCLLAIGGLLGGLFCRGGVEEASAFSGTGETRAIWLAYVDFSSLGMKTNSEATFRAKAEQLLDKAKSNNINAVCFHVRAFDDAAWKSKTFSAMSYLTSKASSSKTAAATYSYDPLGIMIELAHKRNMELHAWMNPYRISLNYFLDPAYESSTQRILTAVREVMAYDVDGIHFDDYFYHAKKGYKNEDNSTVLKASKAPSAAKKRSYVNKMVKAVYKEVKKQNSSAVFGISPQGNIENCMSAGADVDKWMSAEGYVDYIMPQIYWTDQWGSGGKTTMYTDRLKAWKALNRLNIPVYVGLASYRTGGSYKDDPGWGKTSTNLASQLNLLRTYGCKGYGLFSAKDLYRSAASTELNNLNKMVKRIPRLGVSVKDYQSLKIKWSKIYGVSGYEIYRSSSKDGAYEKIADAPGTAGSCADGGLTPGRTYYYKVRAYKSSKTYSFSAVKSQQARPAAPSVSTAAKAGGITVKWSAVSKVTGYYVYRSATKNGTYKALKKASGKTVQYADKGLKKGKRYYYKVRAYKTVDGTRIYSDYSAYSSKIVK